MRAGFGEQLYVERKRAGRTQAELAEAMCRVGQPMEQTNISTLEYRTDAPREKVVRALATCLKVPAARFYNLDGVSVAALQAENKRLRRLLAQIADIASAPCGDALCKFCIVLVPAASGSFGGLPHAGRFNAAS